MAGKIDYKQKYQELKAKFMSSVDSAWQDGYQHGLQDSQLEQAQQQQAQADQMAMASAGQPQPGEEAAPGEEQSDPSQQPASQNPNGDELDQHIAKLESMLGKSEIPASELGDLKKTLNDIRSLQLQLSLSKSMASIKNSKMGKLHKSISFSPRTQANLPKQSQEALSKQHEIISNVFKKWAADEQKAASDITSVLNIEGITKKDEKNG